jgi:hypothetical protein
MSDSGEIEVIVQSFSGLKEVKILTKFYLNLLQTIVHEFGHAYALINKYRYLGDKVNSMNKEIAVLFENKFRARTDRGPLRYGHDEVWYYYKQYWTEFYRWLEEGEWMYYPKKPSYIE